MVGEKICSKLRQIGSNSSICNLFETYFQIHGVSMTKVKGNQLKGKKTVVTIFLVNLTKSGNFLKRN